MTVRAQAVFPSVPADRGHYESFYLKAGHPTEPLAVWIRYTVHKRPSEAATGSLWFTLFDASAGAPAASKLTVGADSLDAGGGDYIRIGESRFGPGQVAGSAPTDWLDASWELEFEPGDEALRHLPRGWMYRAPLPRTKLESPHPGTRFSGTVRTGERTLELDGWPGMVGHNWGAEHAERWIWLHGAAFADAPDAWLDLALGRVRVGRLTTPWVANGMLSLDGCRHRLGGLGAVRSTSVEERPESCRFVVGGDERLTVSGTVDAARSNLVGWVYADPAGPEHNVVNCSIAALALELRRRDQPPRRLATASGAAYELGMRETDHGVPLQPFSDG